MTLAVQPGSKTRLLHRTWGIWSAARALLALLGLAVVLAAALPAHSEALLRPLAAWAAAWDGEAPSVPAMTAGTIQPGTIQPGAGGHAVREQRIAILDQAGEKTLQIGLHIGIIVFLHQQAGGSMLDEQGQQPIGYGRCANPAHHIGSDGIQATPLVDEFQRPMRLSHGAHYIPVFMSPDTADAWL